MWINSHSTPGLWNKRCDCIRCWYKRCEDYNLNFNFLNPNLEFSYRVTSSLIPTPTLPTTFQSGSISLHSRQYYQGTDCHWFIFVCCCFGMAAVHGSMTVRVVEAAAVITTICFF